MLKKILEIQFYNKILLESKEEVVCEKTTIAWARKGNKVVKKYRCPFGRRKGKVVSNLSACSAPRNLTKSIAAKRTRAKKGAIMNRKARRTKRFNPVSKRIKAMNKAMRR